MMAVLSLEMGVNAFSSLLGKTRAFDFFFQKQNDCMAKVDETDSKSAFFHLTWPWLFASMLAWLAVWTSCVIKPVLKQFEK